MTTPLDASTRVRISPSVYARAFGKEVVLLHFGRGEYFGLDEVGAAIWRRLEQGDTLGAAAEAIVSTFAVSREDALRDIIALVSDLRNETLLDV